jgi:hypothetical protein
MSKSTFIGLDVHARSGVAGILEGESGEVRSCKAPARTAELVTWLRAQGEALSVAYEAGPTGFGPARACAEAQIPCLVAAPSKIAKAPGERVKTDRRDALRLARLLRLWELAAVRVPWPPSGVCIASCITPRCSSCVVTATDSRAKARRCSTAMIETETVPIWSGDKCPALDRR